MIWALVAASALSTECPLTVEQGSHAAAGAPEGSALALARAMHSEDIVRSFNRQAAVDSLKVYLGKDPEAAKHEAALPGFSARLLARAPGAIDLLLNERIPWLHRCMAEKLGRILKRPQLEEALAYATSPAGKRLLQEVTDDSIRRYLLTGPLSKAEYEKLRSAPERLRKRAPASAGRASEALLPLLEKWAEEEFKAENELLGALAQDIAEEMAAEVPAPPTGPS